MKVVIPMSGFGERFRRAGYKDHKALIKVEGKTILEHVVNMFPGEEDFVFICNEEHLKTTDMKNVINNLKPNGKIISIVQPKPKGPVWTVLEALKKEDFLKDDEPVVMSYCDFSVWWDYEHFKKTVEETKCDATVISYTGFHPHLLLPGVYAGMRVDENNWMLESREKHSFTENKMDSFHQAGSFYFAKGSYVKKYFKEVVERDLKTNDEYYISGTATQVMKEAGLNVYVYPLEHFLQWGTPRDLEAYKFWSDYFISRVDE